MSQSIHSKMRSARLSQILIGKGGTDAKKESEENQQQGNPTFKLMSMLKKTDHIKEQDTLQ